MGNPNHDARGRFSSGVGGGSRAKGATSPAKRIAQGRAVATIGNETMVMSKKNTPEQTRSKVAAAGARAKMRKAQVNPGRGLGGAEKISQRMARTDNASKQMLQSVEQYGNGRRSVRTSWQTSQKQNAASQTRNR
jgi:hypothetical protein